MLEDGPPMFEAAAFIAVTILPLPLGEIRLDGLAVPNY